MRLPACLQSNTCRCPLADCSFLFCSITAPTASWSNGTLATVSPASLTIPAAAWASPQLLTVQPSPDLVDGDYFLTLQFT